MNRAFVVGKNIFYVLETDELTDTKAKNHALNTESFTFYMPVLNPYKFGSYGYDPFITINESLSKATNDGLPVNCALWAALEKDLYWFTADKNFTAELDKAESSEDWFRFVSLNNLYRSMIKAIVPYGLAPRLWTRWLYDRNIKRQNKEPLNIKMLTPLNIKVLTRPVEVLIPLLNKKIIEFA